MTSKSSFRLPCRRVSPELFFPLDQSDEGQSPTEAEQRALAVCRTCPALATCRQTCLLLDLRALQTYRTDPWGVCGGLTAAQRRVALRNRKQVAA